MLVDYLTCKVTVSHCSEKVAGCILVCLGMYTKQKYIRLNGNSELRLCVIFVTAWTTTDDTFGEKVAIEPCDL